MWGNTTSNFQLVNLKGKIKKDLRALCSFARFAEKTDVWIKGKSIKQ